MNVVLGYILVYFISLIYSHTLTISSLEQCFQPVGRFQPMGRSLKEGHEVKGVRRLKKVIENN